MVSDLTSISTFVGSIKTAADIAKLLMTSGEAIEKAEMQMKLAEMLCALAEAKSQAAAVREELANKQEIINGLRRHIEIADSLVYRAPSYFVKKGDELEGPYCQRCYDSDSKLIHLQQPGRQGYWVCQNCEKSYTDENCEKPMSKSAVRRNRNWVTDY